MDTMSQRPAGWSLCLALSVAILCFCSDVRAQPRQPNDAEAAAACASCAGCGGALVLIPIVFVALNIALLVWVGRDAKARGMDSAVVWMILVMLTSVIGLIIYVFTRPQGNLVKCQHCGNRRLQVSATCPHCANS
jgi:hypothetical protein